MSLNILRLVDRRTGYFTAAVLMVFAVFLPALASAAQISERSIAPSSASVDVEDATYQVKFTSVAAAGAFVVDFCTESPILGQACTTPTGMDVSGADSVTAGFTDVTGSANGSVVVAGTIDASDEVTVDIDGIDNPSVSGTVYARIATFATDTAADSYTSAAPGAVIDDGGVAFAITDTIGVTGAVLESLTFCVSGAEITAAACGNANSNTNLALGEVVGSTRALQPGELHTGDLYAQLSTNAQSGAVVSLKSSAVGCGGLMRAGSSDCDITPADATDLENAGIDAATDAKFGMLVNTAVDNPTGGASNGTITPMNEYGATVYHMGYMQNQATGVTSAYGHPVLNTGSAPINNKNVRFTFGVSAQNSTPAGNYAADLSLIATGTF